MRWAIDGEPEDTDGSWTWTLRRRDRSHRIEVIKPASGPVDDVKLRRSMELSGRNLVEKHLDDVHPPDVVSLVHGLDGAGRKVGVAEMGFTNYRGSRGRWINVAHRLNLPHWLQPRP
jgi:hypothetical protein